MAIACVAALCGCAASHREKMSWAEANPPPAAASADGPFRAVLQQFTDGGVTARRAARSGASMPAERAQAWSALLGRVEAFLARPPRQTSMVDATRARVVVEAELELDAQAYGDIPEQTALAAQGAAKKLAARVGELLALAQLRKVNPKRFAWPVSPVVVTSPFGDRVHPITGDYRMHRGVDLLAELAQPVYAAFAGTVSYAGWNGAHGKQVQLVHDAHWATHYSHLSSWWVQSGDTVVKGQVIGVAGSTGESTGPHVHFELMHDGEAVDPEEQLPAPPPAPLPLALQ
jgi:murein DD-endopeptidase MepM/ murein hydrolase activator NlpD